MIRRTSILILILTLLWGCSKDNPAGCFSGTGNETTVNRSLMPFHSLYLYDNVDVVFRPSPTYGCTLTAGENLLAGITTEVDSLGRLFVRNLNTCNWVRSYDYPITLTLDLPSLDTLEYRSIGNISCTDTLYPDTLVINLFEGAGTIDLLVNARLIKGALHYGTQDMIFRGQCDIFYGYSAGFGRIDAKAMRSRLVYVNNKSSNNMTVWPEEVLGATIEGLGNIYYRGNPPVINFNPIGQGQLLPLTP